MLAHERRVALGGAGEEDLKRRARLRVAVDPEVRDLSGPVAAVLETGEERRRRRGGGREEVQVDVGGRDDDGGSPEERQHRETPPPRAWRDAVEAGD